MAIVENIRAEANPDVEFWLHPEAGGDGVVVIKDQNGRQLRGVKSIDFSAAMDQANELTLTVNSGVDGAMTNRKKNDG